MGDSTAKKLIQSLLPIEVQELPKIVPLFSLFFFISFIYNLLRPLKISLIITAPGVEASILPFLKVWAVLPGAFFFAFVYTKLLTYFRREQVFYIFTGIFLVFFALTALLYPHREQLELVRVANFLQQRLPAGCAGLVNMIRHWHLSCFFVMSELWGNLILTVLAWGFVNESISIPEAKRFYAILAIGADSAGIFSGQFANLLHFKSYQAALPIGNTAWEQTLAATLGAIVLIGLLIVGLYRWLNYKIFTRPSTNSRAAVRKARGKADRLSLTGAIKLIAQSKYLLYMTLIVVGYNIAYNLFDVLWVAELKAHFKNSTSNLNYYMNQMTSWTGILAASIAFLVSGNAIRKLGWTFTAFITPTIMFITSLGFFGLLLAKLYNLEIGMFSISQGIMIFGTLQYCLSRACKYTVFDATKEMAFIPLPKDQQRQGKIIIDSIVSRASKSGGSLIYQGLLLVCAQLIFTTPYVATLIIIILANWCFAITKLSSIAPALTNRAVQEPKDDIIDGEYIDDHGR